VSARPPVAWHDDATDAVIALARLRAGLVFTASRRAGVEAGARRAMARSGARSVAHYLAFVQHDGAALDDLLAELTVGETYFFRDPAQFDFVRRELVPVWTRRGRGAPPRCWSAACATGEEPYSIAILLQEARLRGRVVGTDLSRARLAAAQRARYRQWSLRGVAPAVVQRWFRHDGPHHWTLDPAVRAQVDFRYLNLVEDHWASATGGLRGLDLVLCRNVLIYLDAASIARAAERLVASLADDGWLLLAASDPPIADLVPCETVVTGGGLAYRRRVPQRASTVVTTRVGTRALLVPAHEAELSLDGVAPVSPHDAPMTGDAPRPDAARETAPDSPHDATPAVAHAPTAAEAIRQVRALAAEGARAEAERRCLAALDVAPDVAELHYLHAALLADAGPDAARAALAAVRRALYLDPALVVAQLLLATLLQRLGRATLAGRALDAALRALHRLPPDDAVPAADGASAGRLLVIARMQRALVRGHAA
jgi:chemotaxis protein methyltransferase CheR